MILTELPMLIAAFAAVGTGMIAGFFMSFSDFLMRSFRLAPDPAGIEVMQIINREVLESWTVRMLWFFLWITSGLAAYALFALDGAVAVLLVAAAGFYVTGVAAVTFRRNIPMNEKLAGFDRDTADGARYWREYVRVWTYWNSYRAAGSGAAAACYVAACVLA